MGIILVIIIPVLAFILIILELLLFLLVYPNLASVILRSSDDGVTFVVKCTTENFIFMT